MIRDRLLARLAAMGAAPDYPLLAADVLGIRNASPELARRLVDQALVFEDRRDAWQHLGMRVCQTAPSAPGVYTFLDEASRALYVGKAADVRRRLREHFAARRWLSLKPALARATCVTWEIVGSELEAILCEAQRIRDLQPIVNVQIQAPALRTRAVPTAILRDAVLVLPSVAQDAVELVAVRTGGDVWMRRVQREEQAVTSIASDLWSFVHGGQDAPGLMRALAPLVYSWLAGRGQSTTRIDPCDMPTVATAIQRLTMVLMDPHLFTERIVHRWR